MRKTFAVLPLCIAAVLTLGLYADAAIIEGKLDTELVRGPVDFSILLPDDYDAVRTVYPLIVLLHDRGGGSGFLNRYGPIVTSLQNQGAMQDYIVAAPDCRQSLFLDYEDGSEQWESFLLDEWLPFIQSNFRVSLRSEKTAIAGLGEGGAAALRIGFKRPEEFGVIVALQPFIAPARRWSDVKAQDKFWHNSGFWQIRYGAPINAEHWARNNPASIVRENLEAIRFASPSIYLECGAANSFGLHRGAEYLHQTLAERDVAHEYRLLQGVDHVGNELDGRVADAFLFIERRVNPPAENASAEPLRKEVERLKRNAGLSE